MTTVCPLNYRFSTCCVPQIVLNVKKACTYWTYSFLTLILQFNEQSIVIFWLNWCKNKCFWQIITCNTFSASLTIWGWPSTSAAVTTESIGVTSVSVVKLIPGVFGVVEGSSCTGAVNVISVASSAIWRECAFKIGFTKTRAARRYLLRISDPYSMVIQVGCGNSNFGF